MDNRKSFPLPIKIVIHLVASLVVGMAVCVWVVGEETLLRYARQTKPSLVVFSESNFADPGEEGNGPGIICFGDSNFIYPPDVLRNDKNQGVYMGETIRQAVKMETGKKRVKLLDWSFAGADMFHYYCMFYKAEKLAPDLIIVSVNWRTMGPEWIKTNKRYARQLSRLAPLRRKLTPGSADPFRSRGITPATQLRYKFYFWDIYPVGFKSWVSKAGYQTA